MAFVYLLYLALYFRLAVGSSFALLSVVLAVGSFRAAAKHRGVHGVIFAMLGVGLITVTIGSGYDVYRSTLLLK